MTDIPESIRAYLSAAGRKGGKAAAAKLSPEQLRKRSAKGGRAGKGSKKPRKQNTQPTDV